MKVGGLEKMIFSGAIIFLLLPLFVFSQETAWNLKQKQVIDILDIIRKEPLSTAQFDLYYDSIYYPESDNPAKAGAVVLVKQAILQEQLDYWLVKMPVEFSKRFIKAVYKLLPLVAYGDFSGAVDLIEKYTVEQANNYINDWLKEKQILIGSGIGKYSFPSYKGSWQTINIPYIIVYSPIGANKAKVVIEFYSKAAIEPPQNKGGIGALGGNQDHIQSTVWPWDIWLVSNYNKTSKTPNKIEPFIVRVKGQVVKDKYGNFSWDKNVEGPSVEVEFGKPVPEIDQSDIILSQLPKDQGFLKNKINQIKQTAQGIIEQIKQFLEVFNPKIPQAQISSFITPLEKLAEPWAPLVGWDEGLDNIAEQSELVANNVEEIVNEENAATIQEDLLAIKAGLEQAIREKQAELDQILLDRLTIENTTTTITQATTTLSTSSGQIQICSQATNQEPAFEKVIFNEVAWMGTTKSASDEWIELKNISILPVNLNGWQIFNKSQNLKIFFTTTTIVEAGGFWLLERTNDDTVPNIKANYIYTGALANINEALYLISPNCVLQDRIIAIPYWQEGDNTTKETMERNQFYGWQTSSVVGGTPKAINSIGKRKSFGGGGSGGSGNNNQLLIINNQNTTSTATSTGSATSIVATTSTMVLITEIQIESTEYADDEFIELFNPNEDAILLEDWSIQKATPSGTISKKNFRPGDSIPAKGYFLIVNSHANQQLLGLADMAHSSFSIASGNTIFLVANHEYIVSGEEESVKDKVGFGMSRVTLGVPFSPEIDFAIAPAEKSGESLGRKLATTTSQYQDTNNNREDFETQTSTPKVQNSIATTSSATSTNSGQATTTQVDDLPATTTAQANLLDVVINEVAWMGTQASANHEWIELYNNTDQEINLTGWQIVGAGTNPVFLTGEISFRGFYLLERTASTTIINVIEDQIYTGALSNNGEKMELKDPQGNVIDLVDCSAGGWFAGDNFASTSRKTMERKSSVVSGDDASNWADNDGITINGLDINNNLILGTPKAQNSVFTTGSTTSTVATTTQPEELPAIADLMVVPSTARGAVDLFWTCPTSATAYIIKKSEQEITTSSWDTAQTISQNIAPKSVGEIEFLQIGGLDTNKKYYFAIKYTGLTGGAFSLISDSVSVKAWQGFQDNTDGTLTTDLRTGLVWFKDASSSINNFGASSTQDNAVAFITGQNSDWRMPNFKELASLFNYAFPTPEVGKGFENIKPEKYWSKSKRLVNMFPMRYSAWPFDFSNGKVEGDTYTYENGENSALYSFMATKNQGIPGGLENDNFDFTDNTDGTVKDNRTGLIWLNATLAQTISNRKNWDSAFLFASNAVLCNDGTLQGKEFVAGDCSSNGGARYDDFRLPNVQELMEITKVDNNAGPRILPSLSWNVSYYWTGTMFDEDNVWYVGDGTSFGSVLYRSKTGEDFNIQLVREE